MRLDRLNRVPRAKTSGRRLSSECERTSSHPRQTLTKANGPPWRAAVCCLVAVMLATAAGAEEPAEEAAVEQLVEMSLDELLDVEVDTVYAAARHKQKLAEAPSSVTIVTADEIQKFGYRTFTDVLRSVRGIYTTYDRNYSYTGIRGFNRPGDYDTRILILVDGHRLNDNVYDMPETGTELVLDVDMIDRVEIVRGPGSALYGSNAILAVINVITKRGRNLQGAEASGAVGSLETFKGRLSYGKQFENGLDLLLSGSVFDSEGQEHLYFREFDTPSTNHGVASHVDGSDFHNLFGALSYGNFTIQGAYSSAEKELPTASYGTWFNSPRTRTIDDRAYLDLRYEDDIRDDLSVMARVFYDYFQYQGYYDYDYSETDTPHLVVNKDSSEGQWWGAELALRKQFAGEFLDRHTLTLGAEFRNNFQQEQRNYDIWVYVDDRRDSTIWAVFFQDEFRILDNLRLDAGLRHDHYESFGGTTNPRAALIYDPFSTTTLKLLWGTAFRAPNAYELFYHDGNSQKSNPDLDPETIDSYEVVLEQRLSKRLNLMGSGFYYELGDVISAETDPADGLLVFRNVDNVTSKGAELEVTGRWPGGLMGRTSYTYALTEDGQTGERLTNSPEHLAKFNLVLPVVREKLFTGLEVQYTSQRKALRGGNAGGSSVLNATLLGRRLWRGLDASITVYNLFDERYADPASGEFRQNLIEQDGRAFWLRLTYGFGKTPAPR